MKIIPAIDLMGGQVVRLLRGDPDYKTTYYDDPIHVAKKWQDAGADMLHIVDLDATLGRGSNISVIHDVAKSVKIPIQVAGGLRDQKTIRDTASIASRVVVGTMAFRDRSAFEVISEELGKDRVVVSTDHYGSKIAISGWQEKTNTGLFDAINDFVQSGFSEFLVTNVERDGTMSGPDLENLKKVCQIDGVNAIASGGISSIHDVASVSELAPFGVILGKALYEGAVSISEAKKYGTN